MANISINNEYCQDIEESEVTAFFTPGLGVGGIERVFINYANILSREGYKIIYIVCQTSGELVSLLSPEVKLINLGCGRLSKCLFPLSKYLRHHNIKNIICANSATIIIQFAKILSRSRVRIIASQHNYINVDTTNYLERNILWSFYNHCHKVIAISNGIQQLLVSKGVDPSKTILIRNPIDFSSIRDMAKDSSIDIPNYDYFAFVGRLSKVKNLDLLIDSFSELQKRHSIRLIIIGDGPEKDKLAEKVKEMNLYDKIIFYGSVSNPYPLMSKAKFIALPSLSEAYPTVVVESLFLGKTVVSTPNPGASEILNYGEFGYISKDFSVACYSDMLHKALENPISSSYLTNIAISVYDPMIPIKGLIDLITK